jgi:hypothetical protein
VSTKLNQSVIEAQNFSEEISNLILRGASIGLDNKKITDMVVKFALHKKNSKKYDDNILKMAFQGIPDFLVCKLDIPTLEQPVKLLIGTIGSRCIKFYLKPRG